ncbi:uncharacterized protein LOC113861385 isoform X5 [Abrus precatorius]|uniref:Uncharacterized protein LOC113861385 isoform X5 n=1 Tax=Abrus precatorius TaxID=3816 RepID=A0A8B8L138_ABRPR|nr:uncharacterized protein LOC113861385 isoform X5 [Abrus precatorius]
MVQSLCLMASHGYPPGLVLQQELSLAGSNMKGCSTLLPSTATKPDLIRYQVPCLKPSPHGESRKFPSECFDYNKFVNVDFSAQNAVLTDEQEAGRDGANLSLLSNLMKLQSSGIGESQQSLSSLIYPHSNFNIRKPLLYLVQDSALSSKITVHPDGQITFMGSGIELKDLLTVVAESYLSQRSHRGEKRSMLVPHFSRFHMDRVDIGEAKSRSHFSTLKDQSMLTAPLRSSPEKVKLKPPPRKNKKVGRERDLFKKNSSHACETLLSLMVNKKQCPKTAIISLKKSGPKLPELLTQFSACIAGTGLAVLLSVMCNIACGRVPFCASNLFNTGFGFGLVWLSWAVNKLRATVVSISKNAGKLGLKEEKMMQKLDKSLRDIYYSAAALLAVVVLRFA